MPSLCQGPIGCPRPPRNPLAGRTGFSRGRFFKKLEPSVGLLASEAKAVTLRRIYIFGSLIGRAVMSALAALAQHVGQLLESLGPAASREPRLTMSGFLATLQ